MYKGEMHANVRRAYLAEGMSGRETYQVFGLHREVVRKMWPIRYRPATSAKARRGDPSLSLSPA